MMEVASAFINKSGLNNNSTSSATCSESMNNMKRWEPEAGSILDPFHIEDLLDFSNEDIAGPIGEEGQNNNSSSCSVTTTTPTTLTTSSGDVVNKNTSSASQQQQSADHPANEFSIDCDAMPELEWLSSLVEDDTFSMGELHKNMFIGSKGGENGGASTSNMTSNTSNIINSSSSSGKRSYSATNLLIEDIKSDSCFQVGSPISVLESSATSGRMVSVGKDVSVPGRPRSKRSRTSSPRRASSTWNNSTSPLIISGPMGHNSPTTSSISDKDFPSSEDNSGVYEDGGDSLLNEDHPVIQASNSSPRRPPPRPPAGRAVTVTPMVTPVVTPAMNCNGVNQVEPRRCTHCLSQKTPQWRAGPQGPKTLCNACGVRYKSGRLFPEYRPALSPTFVSEVHSNSHRKVLEMRRHKEVNHHHHHRGGGHGMSTSTAAGGGAAAAAGEVVDGGLIYK